MYKSQRGVVPNTRWFTFVILCLGFYIPLYIEVQVLFTLLHACAMNMYFVHHSYLLISLFLIISFSVKIVCRNLSKLLLIASFWSNHVSSLQRINYKFLSASEGNGEVIANEIHICGHFKKVDVLNDETCLVAINPGICTKFRISIS